MPRRRSARAARPNSQPRPSESPAANPELHAAILAVVDAQLETRQPAETWATLERLVAAGYTAEGARQLIATTVAAEIFAVMASRQPYNQARYIAALKRLPQPPDRAPDADPGGES